MERQILLEAIYVMRVIGSKVKWWDFQPLNRVYRSCTALALDVIDPLIQNSIFACFCSATTTIASEAKRHMRVMTFNLRMNTPDDGPNAWPHRVRLVQQTVLDAQPAILGTQEVLPSMLSDLEAVLPDYAWIGHPRREDDERCAIFYKRDVLTLLSSRTFWLSETPDVPESLSWQSSLPRVCTYATFQDTEHLNPPFAMFNTHLDHMSEKARVKGLTVILQQMKEVFEKDRIKQMILTGDFNDIPSSPALNSLEFAEIADGLKLINSYHTLATHDAGKTFHGFHGGEVGEPIDYIFVTGNMGLNAVTIHREPLLGRYASDHYAIVADISL